MRTFSTALAAGAAFMLLAATAEAQSQSQAQAQTQAQTQAQSQTQAAPGPGMGRGGGMGMGHHGSAHDTYGWSMMTAEERQAHDARMQGFTDRKSCEAYVAEHHRLMSERAAQRGMGMPAQPRRDPCAGLK